MQIRRRRPDADQRRRAVKEFLGGELDVMLARQRVIKRDWLAVFVKGRRQSVLAYYATVR